MLTVSGWNSTYGTMMTLDLWGVVVNVMICKKFGLDRHPYNSACTTVQHVILPVSQINRLQSVLNAAARLIFVVRGRDHVT